MDQKPSDVEIIVINLRTSLDGLRDALEAASKSSEKYAGRLACATWALVAVTVVLAIVASVPLFK
jgi:hypothetical protein